MYEYSRPKTPRQRGNFAKVVLALLIVSILAVLSYVAYYNLYGKKSSNTSLISRLTANLVFDSSVTEDEKATIQKAITTQSKHLSKDTNVHVATTLKPVDKNSILSAYVPVTHIYSTMQSVRTTDFKAKKLYVARTVPASVQQDIAKALLIDPVTLTQVDDPLAKVDLKSIALIKADDLTAKVKLLALNDSYYLDKFTSGAVFRNIEFSGEGASDFAGLNVYSLDTKDTILKVNMSGVTAITRRMLKKYSATKDPSYFGKKIASFLADADITHVSNEVSFQDNCQYSNTVFCAHPDTIQTLKDSGVDLVELTGNHNNDVGSAANTKTIKMYQKLGWKTVGGGLNNTEAAKYYVANKKGSKVAFLAYNYPDSPNGGAISKETTAGANSFDFDKIKTDIKSAKTEADFVIVNVQYWECYAYPDGFVEFPICDKPIANQEEIFKKIVDLGANMVIGSSAHQPQTYETYKQAPIYYGLGNLYFEQIEWPGTERGIILTHYFKGGKLIQTKLTPTVYDQALQTRKMTEKETAYLLKRLSDAR